MDADDVRLSSKYEALLKEQGYEIQKVFDNKIYFNQPKGYGYSLSFDSAPKGYISIGFGINIDEASSSLGHRYEVIQHVNENIKFVKLYLDKVSAQFSCDHVLQADAHLKGLIDISMVAMNAAYQELVRKFAELEG